jgi:low affinity Fe/Cu permease
MVFLIQNTQNRDSKAFHIKLNELIRGVHGARTSLVGVEDLSDEELESLHKEFENIHKRYATELERRTGKKAGK